MIDKSILKKIKLVVFDLDGTLINDQNIIGDETKFLIKELSLLGVQFSIATGRLLSAATDHANELGIKIPLITLDGTLIKRYPGEDSIFQSPLPVKHVKRALKLADKYLVQVALCHDKAIYYTEENSLFPQLMDKFGAKYQQIFSYDNYLLDTLEIIMVSDYKENIKHISKKMSFPYTFGCRASYYKSSGKGGNYYVEIRKMGCSKGDGLKRLLKHLKIKIKETAVVGDWYNDKSLFENDSLKVAMGNAVPELKRMADLILKKSNNEDGTADFLKMLLQAKK